MKLCKCGHAYDWHVNGINNSDECDTLDCSCIEYEEREWLMLDPDQSMSAPTICSEHKDATNPACLVCLERLHAKRQTNRMLNDGFRKVKL